MSLTKRIKEEVLESSKESDDQTNSNEVALIIKEESDDQTKSNEVALITKEDLQSSWKLPSLAQFVSLCRFAFKLPEIEIEEVEDGLLQETEIGCKVVQDLLVGLLRSLRPQRGVTLENHEEHLRKELNKIKVTGDCLNINLTEETGFVKLDAFSKLDLLYALCLSRLDRPDVLEAMKNMDAETLRVQPLGCDDLGNEYWYFYGTRLYKQEPAPEKKKDWQEEWVDQKNQSFSKRGRGRPRKRATRKSEGENDDFELDTSKRRYMNIDAKSRWSVVCNTIEDWVDFAEKLKKSKSKCEKALFHTVTDNFLPVLNDIYQEKERKLQEKLKQLIPKPAPRRIETRRMTTRKIQDLNGFDSVNAHKEHLVRDRAYRLEERNRRATTHGDERSRGRSARRSYVDEYDELHDSYSQDTSRSYGSEESRSKFSPLVRTDDTDMKSKILHVLSEVKLQTSCSWPFLVPVDENHAPGYYEIIQEPMDLSTMTQKVMENSYRTINDIDEDFKKMVSNCKLYNGEHSEMSEMVMNLWRTFRKSINRVFGSDTQDTSQGVKTSKPSTSSQHTDSDSQDSTYGKRKMPVKKKKKIRHKEALEILSREADKAVKKFQSSEMMQIDAREADPHSKQNSMFSDLKIVPINSHPPELIEKFSSDSSNHSNDMDSGNETNSPHHNQSLSASDLAATEEENLETKTHTNSRPSPILHYVSPNDYTSDLCEFMDGANTSTPNDANNLNTSFNPHSSSSPDVHESEHASSPPNTVQNVPQSVVSERTVPLLQDNFNINELSSFTSYEASTINPSALGLLSNQTVYRKPFGHNQIPVTTSVGTSSQASFSPPTSAQVPVNRSSVEPLRSSPTYSAQALVPPQSQQLVNQQNQALQITKESTQYYQYQKSSMEMAFPAVSNAAATIASQLPMASTIANSTAQIPLQVPPYSKAFPNQGSLVLPQPEVNKYPNVKFSLPPSTGEILLVPGDPASSSMTFHLFAQPTANPSQPIQSSMELKASNVSSTVEPLANQQAANSVENQVSNSRVANREDSIIRPQKRKSPLQDLQDLVVQTTTATSLPSHQPSISKNSDPGFPGPVRFTDASPNFSPVYPNSSNTVIRPSASLQRPQYNPNNTSISYSSASSVQSSSLRSMVPLQQNSSMFQTPVQKTMASVFPSTDKRFVSMSDNASATSIVASRPSNIAPKKIQLSGGNLPMSSNCIVQNPNSVIQNPGGQLVFLPPAKESIRRSGCEEQVPKMQSLGKPVPQTCASYFPSANNTMLQQSFAFQNAPMNPSQIYTQVVPSQLQPQFVNNPYYIITDPNAFQGAQRYPVMNMQPISFTNR